MRFLVEIARDAEEAAAIAHRQIVEGEVASMRVVSEDGTETEVQVGGNGAVISEEELLGSPDSTT
jgi:hypothetical protein